MDTQLPTDSSQLDPKVVKVMRAIKQIESKGMGGYNAVGDGGESHGAYQFNKNNFKTWAGQYLGDENAPMTPANQNKLMYLRIKQQKDSGLSPDEIAAIHNGASKDESGHYVYNQPSYGVNFRKALMGDKSQNTSSSGSGIDRLRKLAITSPETTPDNQDPTAPGHVMENLGKGEFGNAIQSGIRGFGSLLTGGGSEELGKGISSPVALAGEKIKGAFGGQDNSQYVAPQTAEEKSQAIKGGLKTGGAIAALAATPYAVSKGAGLISKVFGNKIAPETMSVIEESLPKGLTKEAFLSKGKIEQLDILGDALKSATSRGSAGTAKVLTEYMNKIDPVKTSGFLTKMAKEGFKIAKFGLLTKALGDTAGGIIHKVTGN